jgi:hypothetical protein
VRSFGVEAAWRVAWVVDVDVNMDVDVDVDDDAHAHARMCCENLRSEMWCVCGVDSVIGAGYF